MENQKSWFKRNWVWAIPGCGCVSIILLIVFGLGATFFGITKLFKNSSPYNHAVEQVKNNPKAVAELGDLIETTLMINGAISLKNDNGNADYSVPLMGSKGKGTLFVVAEKFDGEWIYEELYVIIKETQEKINLLDQSLEGI
jgi:hypothetical protein